jgi:hypothetical protein
MLGEESATEGKPSAMSSRARKSHTLTDDWERATSIALVRVAAVSPATANTPDGVAPTPGQARTLGYSLFTVSQITYDVLNAFKGNPPSSEWMPGGRIPHPPGTLASSVEDYALPSVGSELVLFLKDGTDWRMGHGVPLVGYPKIQMCYVDDEGQAVCSGYAEPLSDLIERLEQLASGANPAA